MTFCSILLSHLSQIMLDLIVVNSITTKIKGLKLLLGYVYKLRPNLEQSAKIDSWLDKLRATYNWSLADRINTYQQRFIQGEYCDLRTRSVACPLTCCVLNNSATGEPWRKNGEKRTAKEIQITALPQLKKARPWYREIDSTVLQQNLERLNKAYENFFAGRGFPKFKNRSNFKSFTYATGVQLKGNKIYLPKLGWMRYYNSRPIPDGFKVKSVTVRKKADGYYVSIRIENSSIPSFPILPIDEVKTVIGVDAGVTKLLHCSDKSVIENPRFGTNPKTKRQLKIRQRRLSRCKKGSKNSKKKATQLAKLHHKIKQKREAYAWKVAHKIVKKADCIVVEDLNIQGLLKRCKPIKCEQTGRFLPNDQSAKKALHRSIIDASWHSLFQKSEYLAAKLGKVFLKVDPKKTSQTCPKCGYADKENRNKEKFVCLDCGHFSDSDWNASINLKNRAISQFNLKIKQPRKVRQDLSEPKQLSLFETPSPELTEVQRRQHSARNSKRDVPGNPPTQLSLWDIQDLA